MGLFSNLRKAPDQNTGQSAGQVNAQEETARAVLAIPLMVAASDGEITTPETMQISNMCSFSPVFLAIGGKRTSDLGVEIVEEIKARGMNDVFQRAAAALSPKLRETAMCFAIRTALADGVLEDNEKKMLVTMGESMGIPQETFMKIFDVMAMMQRAPGA